MYLYSFDKLAGPDKVFTVTMGNAFGKKIHAGDLIKSGKDIFLCLGDKISFPEQYQYFFTPSNAIEIIYPSLLSTKSIHMIHWMVYTYYSTYKFVIKYFLNEEWQNLLEKEIKRKKNKINSDFSESSKIKQNDILTSKISPLGQTLVVYPDLRTIFNLIDEEWNTWITKKEIAFLNSHNSQAQKDKDRRAIKTGKVSQIYASPSEIFQDFYDLKKIVFIDPHKRYYANQQDPRYKVGAVLEEMSKIYKAELEIIGN